jgi:hypothetical protein
LSLYARFENCRTPIGDIHEIKGKVWDEAAVFHRYW